MKQRLFLKTYYFVAVGLAVVTGGQCGLSPAKGNELPLSAATNVLTLDGAIRLALENNPELRAARARVEAAGGQAYQAKLWSNPELTLSAEDWPLSGGGFAESKRLIGVAQTVPYPGKKPLDKKIGVSGVLISEAEAARRRIELVRDTKCAFYRVLASKRLVEVQKELVRVAESSAETARKRVEAGGAAAQEQLRAEILLEQANADLAGLERELATSRQTLLALLGKSDFGAMNCSGELIEKANPQLLERQTSDWLPAHPSMVIASRNRERADLELRRARLEPYPDVRFGVSGGQESERGGSIVQFGISVPLPVIDRSKGRKQQARANVNVAAAESAAVEHELLRDWAIARERVNRAASQVASYRERILPKADEALHLVQTGFEEGKFGFIDLLDTQRTAAEARLNYQQKLLELNIAQAELESFVCGEPAVKPATTISSNSQP